VLTFDIITSDSSKKFLVYAVNHLSYLCDGRKNPWNKSDGRRSGNWVDIASENNLSNPGVIEVGQELTIPDVEPKQPTTTQAGETPEELEPISGATYTVLGGDNLWDISVRAYGDGYRWVDIAQENELGNPNLIHAGNVLTLPR